MKVMIEGADCTGKTTLANILAFRYGLVINHCSQHDPSDPVFYRESLRKENTVWDRHTIGELIYPKIFSRPGKTTKEEAKAIIDDAKREGVKICVLTVPDHVLHERLAERPDEHQLIVNNIERINREFLEWAQYLQVPVLDTTSMTLQEIFNWAERRNNEI